MSEYNITYFVESAQCPHLTISFEIKYQQPGFSELTRQRGRAMLFSHGQHKQLPPCTNVLETTRAASSCISTGGGGAQVPVVLCKALPSRGLHAAVACFFMLWKWRGYFSINKKVRTELVLCRNRRHIFWRQQVCFYLLVLEVKPESSQKRKQGTCAQHSR